MSATPAYADDAVTLYLGDCLDVLADLPDASVHAVVTDPPYGLEFMGREWDAPWKAAADVHAEARTRRAAEMGDETKRRFIAAGVNRYEAGAGFQAWCERWAAECLRVLTPGGHLLAFGGSRTWHRLACGIEEAGFEIRDSIAWLYGAGFPKSLDVSKAIDKAAGHHRGRAGAVISRNGSMNAPNYACTPKGAPITLDAARWAGWGTALKPAFEPVIVARKPLAGTVAATVLAHGTGALHIDACRVEMNDEDREKYLRGWEAWVDMSERRGQQREDGTTRKATEVYGTYGVAEPVPAHEAGRWPPNVVLDDAAADALDATSGTSTSRKGRPRAAAEPGPGWGMTATGAEYDDDGGASRFFPRFRYTAKAGADERPRAEDGTGHPTVKPVDLMRWLVRLVTPPGGIVLDPFLGSGTTMEAALAEGFAVVGIERDPDYLDLVMARLARPVQPVLDLGGLGGA